LLFSCLGRGRGLFGEPDHDSRALARALGPVPLAGFFCNGEIGPVEGRTFLHGYTSAFGIFRPKGGAR
jgi:small ligand-binding sensory domain FIST